MSTVILPIKIDKDVKNSFISVCKSQESDASKELRKFINDYIKKHSQQDLFKSN